MPLPYSVGREPEIDDLVIACGLDSEGTVELRPVLRVDLGVEFSADLDLASRSESQTKQVLGPGAHAMSNVFSRDHQIPVIITLAMHDNMDVRMFGLQ
jgi:hypothetical protein